jgi:hypothetical protein
MDQDTPEHALEFLLAFDGYRHHYSEGYYTKFEIKRTEVTPERPHGLRYSFTLHGPDGTRLVGFDNAHAVAPAGSRFRKRPAVADHWHRTEDDPGRPYQFVSAEKLVDDFFDEVERVLIERGIPFVVTAQEKTRQT